jgi:hypothetical protein
MGFHSYVGATICPLPESNLKAVIQVGFRFLSYTAAYYTGWWGSAVKLNKVTIGLAVVGLVVAEAGRAADDYGQWLVRRAMAADPSLAALELDAKPPKSSQVVVLASNDPAALGRPVEGMSEGVRHAGDHTFVRVALKDVSQDDIGQIEVAYRSSAGSDATLTARARQVGEQLSRHISHVANLLDPYPYEKDAPLNTQAQALVESALLRHPDIEILAIHATPPDSDYNVIVGSNIGRLGKKADNDDMRCVYTGKPNLEVNAAGNRFESEMRLHDKKGHIIGALGVVYAYAPGVDRVALHAKAETVRRELELAIEDSAGLFATSSNDPQSPVTR